MNTLTEQTPAQLQARLQELENIYADYKSRQLSLDMSRGKPGADQLDLTVDLLTCVNEQEGFRTANGFETRNYGLVDGIPEVKALFADILGVTPDQVIVGGNSSLNMMFDYIASAYAKGVGGCTPWCKLDTVKFLCPAPGYDRHFAVTNHFGVDMIAVPMTATGPDMDMVEELVQDPAVKGMWCVPMYSNPDGITYSDDTVRRLAKMQTAATDFRVMWDNAYCMHHLSDDQDVLLNVYDAAKEAGTQDRFVMFTSTSKISFPGAGVAAMAASPANIAEVKARMTVQTIGYDKINMLRHARFFKDIEGIKAHMRLHAAILRPKFAVVLEALAAHKLQEKGVATWHNPKGGYFVSVNVMAGCAKETVRLLKEAGVVMTGAGATYPYGNDPADSNIRIAPTFPALDELKTAMELFCVCAELAAVRKLLA